MKVLKFVIVGHVDHGKSTLIGRLLYDTHSLPDDKMEEIKKASKNLGRETEFAYLLDHLEEERQQGITIDTTQVFFQTPKRTYVIIDAPGHREFIKNMVTGASQADAGVLIVDVKEGIKDQTKRHAYLLSILGIKQIIVAINKLDLVNFNQEKYIQIRDEIEKFLAAINIKALHYIPISARKGDNVVKHSEFMAWYKGPTFVESLDLLDVNISSQNKEPIFPVQDVYNIEDRRLIVGRIESGSIKKGMEIIILPGGEVTKVNSVEKYMKELHQAQAGESIGITTEEPIFANRGDVISQLGKEPELKNNFSATIFWLAKNDFYKNNRLTIRCATQETICEIEKIKKRIDSGTLNLIEEDSEELKHSEVAEVIMKTKKPLVIKSFNEVPEMGRFVLLQDGDVCAGGIVTGI
jgi:sulfate adenylyltransferase large subunit